MLNIQSNRECFFDDYLIDVDKTTAEFRIHPPVLQGAVMDHYAPWEGDACGYHNFFYDNGIYRMYYRATQTYNEDRTRFCESSRICYAESSDGIHWVKPSLNICEWNGSKDNNIIVDQTSQTILDNFMVFRDDNPACPPEQRYKGIVKDRKYINGNPDDFIDELWGWYSADAIHFEKGPLLTTEGKFDSMNVVFWDAEKKIYRMYIRGFHGIPEGVIDAGVEMGTGVRDIRYAESEDFLHWSHPVMLEFGDVEDYQLYTNNVMVYERAPQMLIGFPTRYVERPVWTGNYDELCGKEERKFRMQFGEREGLAITDCLFMVSRDGVNFTRYDEAFMRPGPEEPFNWLYGDCYPARGFIQTPSKVQNADPELSMYAATKHCIAPGELNRYTVRMDGFVSLHAGGKKETVVTKPFVYSGRELFINFATSAQGYLNIKLITKDGEAFRSVETFGDSIDRRVVFEQQDTVGMLSGQKVVMQVEMLDADLYAIQFR